MAPGPKIVHKQFNSPIGLYSRQNISETLGKHLQNLDNGSVGIDFNNPNTDKPTNLANSAVLRMLEEEERNRRGYPKLDASQMQAILETLPRASHPFDSEWPPERARMRGARSWDGQLNTSCQVYSEFLRATKGQKKVVWPPVPETNGYPQTQQPTPAHHESAPQQQQQHQPQSPQYQPPAQQYQPPAQQYKPPQQYQQPQQQYQPPTQQYQPQSPAQQYQNQSQAPFQQKQPAFCEGKRQEATGLSRLIPVGPGVTAAPTAAPYRQAASPAQNYRHSASPAQSYRQPQSPAPANRWAPVAPLSPQAYGCQPAYPAQSEHSPQPPFSPEPYQKPFSPPPTTITLRQQQPVHQQPPPVYASQPAAASFQGGVNMRGDQKWPPQDVREAVAAENEARRQLAKGPACRPRKVKKDYSSFFAQNALNSNYPGYRAPPGTQHYEELSGRSSY